MAINRDVNPSYHFVTSSNIDGEMIDHEYDDVSENNVVQAHSPYMEIVEKTTKLHCENLAYVGSTK